jgi:iron complex transport system substrate-binding protein
MTQRKLGDQDHTGSLQKFVRWLFIAIGLLVVSLSRAEITVVDDAGEQIMLATPARRIVSLAPHLTEILYAIGAGDRLVGVTQYSDYPPAARSLVQVGGSSALDLERILSLKPDLIVAWSSGNNPAQLERLRAAGFVLFTSEPRHIVDIPATARRLSQLTGTEVQARQFVQTFNQRYTKLQQTYAGHRPVRLFYEIWPQPLMTVNGEHLISDVMRLCGAVNIFAEVPALVPTVSVEAVLAAAPEIIIAGGREEEHRDWLKAWRRWTQLPAVKHNQLYFINPDYMQRQGPRILDGAEQLCVDVERARQTTP